MKRRSNIVLVACVAALALFSATGCSKRHRVQFESNTCWRAVIDGQSGGIIEDCQNANYKVLGDMNCVTIQTRTTVDPVNFVRVRIDDGDWSTNAVDNGGSITICRK